MIYISYYVDKLLHVSSTHTELTSQPEYIVSAFCISNVCTIIFKSAANVLLAHKLVHLM